MKANITQCLLVASTLVSTSLSAADLQADKLPLTRCPKTEFLIINTQFKDKVFPFVLDTGAGIGLAVSDKIADKISVKAGNIMESGAVAGKAKMQSLDLLKLSFVGNKNSFTSRDNFSINLDNCLITLDNKQEIAAGMIGACFLDELNAAIDTKVPELIIPTKNTEPNHYLNSLNLDQYDLITLHRGGSQPFVFAEIKGKKFLFLVDTAAAMNTLEPEVVENLELKSIADEILVQGAGTSSSQAKAYCIEELRLGEAVKLNNVSFVSHSTGKLFNFPKGVTYGGIIGIRPLCKIKAIIDLGSYRLIIPK